ncbi:cation diffusion facilitator family transporter [Phenylobacterium sp.]|uniref:cation diffusion facilitator family transporter n=1 Tax=Phenylobacterium sp. TaxID=1871053 RepID=UPI0027336DF3|nr:cation diffusion facilitator family transporter [Phenylobacterium sp.]MDP3659300.1 cation diffusion facilitator family transporter [Phenylobacterium sp.]
MIPIDPTSGAADTSPQVAPARMDAFRADRVYLGADHARNERRTWIVTAICAATLAAQLIGGLAFKSMALTAAGLHMAAHVAVLLVAAFAYRVARQRKDDPRYAFGTGKIGFLAGFANAVVLAATAFLIALESIERLIEPAAVDYDSALPLAAAGLAVTIVCVWLLKPARAAHDGDADLNLSAAHLHLSADALVGVLTLAGLAAGRSFGWSWTDPAAGLVGAALVAQFAWSLLRRTGGVLLDMNPSPALVAEIRARLQAQGERVVDLHLWRLGPGHHAAIVVLEAAQPQDVQAYRARLAGLAGLSHLTIEVRRA